MHVTGMLCYNYKTTIVKSKVRSLKVKVWRHCQFFEQKMAVVLSSLKRTLHAFTKSECKSRTVGVWPRRLLFISWVQSGEILKQRCNISLWCYDSVGHTGRVCRTESVHGSYAAWFWHILTAKKKVVHKLLCQPVIIMHITIIQWYYT